MDNARFEGEVCFPSGSGLTFADYMMKRITLILNWLTIATIAVISVLPLFSSHEADSEELAQLGIIGGADGPTAVFISTEIDPITYLIPVGIILILLLNIVVITKKKKNCEPAG